MKEHPDKEPMTGEWENLAEVLRPEDPPVPAVLDRAVEVCEREHAGKLVGWPRRASPWAAAAAVLVGLILAWQWTHRPPAADAMVTTAATTYPTHQFIENSMDYVARRLRDYPTYTGQADNTATFTPFSGTTDRSLDHRLDSIRARVNKLKQEPLTQQTS